MGSDATPAIILVIEAQGPEHGFLDPRWKDRWAEVETLPAGVSAQDDDWLMRRFGPFLRLSPQMPPPHLVGAQVGLAVSELDQLQAAAAPGAPWAFVLFMPSQLACLDILRKGRQTLVAARDLQPGQAITAQDLALKDGGSGIDAAQKDRVLGCGLCYPLRAGDDLTFGFLQWTEQTR